MNDNTGEVFTKPVNEQKCHLNERGRCISRTNVLSNRLFFTQLLLQVGNACTKFVTLRLGSGDGRRVYGKRG